MFVLSVDGQKSESRRRGLRWRVFTYFSEEVLWIPHDPSVTKDVVKSADENLVPGTSGK